MASLLLTAVIVLPTVIGQLLIKPENQAISISGTAVMNCATNVLTGTQPLWYTKSSNSDVNAVLVSENKLSINVGYIRINNSTNGHLDLIIPGIRNAGRIYICIEPGSLDTASAELVILDDLVCNDSSNDTHIDITCSRNFTGNWSPEIHWTVNEDYVPQEYVTNETKRNESVTSRLLTPRNSTIYLVSCKTMFSESGRPSETTAKNVPAYVSIHNISSETTAMSPELTTESLGVNGGAMIAIIIFGTLLAVGLAIYKCRKIRRSEHAVNGQGHVGVIGDCSANDIMLRDMAEQDENNKENGHA